MNRPVWLAGAILLALSACAAPTAETPTETPAAPVEEAAVSEPVETPAAPQPIEVQPAAPAAIEAPAAFEPPTPEAPLDPETLAIIENAIAALSPPEATEPETAVPVAPTAKAPVTEPAPEPVIDDDPEQLMGLAAGALTELLGDPGFRREDADAQVWQYRGVDCVLDVYLYRDGEATPHRVTYYEFRGDGGGRPCLRDLLLAQAD